MKLASMYQLHLPRKAWHLSMGLLVLLLCQQLEYLGLTFQRQGSIFLGVALIVFAGELLRLRWRALNQFILSRMSLIIRQEEQHKLSGTPFYLLGIGLSLLCFHPSIAFQALLILIIADPLSSFVGIKWGTWRLAPRRTVEGSLAFMAVTFFLLFFWVVGLGLLPYPGALLQQVSLQVIVFKLVLASLMITLGEIAAATVVDDNLVIPLCSGLVMTLLLMS